MLIKACRFHFNYCLTRSINNVNPSLIGIMQKQSAMLDREHAILASTKRDGRKYYFMICDVCFWCASIFDLDLSKYRDTFLCPVCQGSKVQAIQLAPYEVYGLKYSESSRLRSEFF
jgi:hypothetical protein